MFLKKQYILALDSGSVKNRAVIINREGQICSYAEKKISMYTPHESWVEQDPDEIWSTQLFVARKAIKLARLEPSEIAAIAVTNQRETTIVWDEKTGRPIYPAISWQSRQTGDLQATAQGRVSGRDLAEDFSCHRAVLLGHETLLDF